MKLFPFSALRPATPELAAQIASLPYDVVDTDEARALAAGNPLSFLHVVRSEIDLPDGTDPHSDPVYAQARKALESLVADGRLVREEKPALYLYRQTMDGASQTAVVACCSIDDYASGRILRHEKTRKDKEDDRTRHILETRAHTGQVFLCYEDLAAIDALVEAEAAQPPLCDFVAADGVGHAVWRVRDPAPLLAAFEDVPRAFIADGHHRSAASFRAGTELRAAEGPDAESGRFMACLFPASQLRILPYNRCVRDLNGLSPRDLLKAALARGLSAASCRSTSRTRSQTSRSRRTPARCASPTAGTGSRGRSRTRRPRTPSRASTSPASRRTSSPPSSASATRAPTRASTSSAASAAPPSSSATSTPARPPSPSPCSPPRSAR